MGRTFTVSDLHGMINLYRQIKEFLKPEDKVYYLGDMGDRGPDCWETVKVILSDPQFICLKGNHEDMLIKAIEECLKYGGIIRQCHEISLLYLNGGMKTLDGFLAENDFDQMFWLRKLKELPVHLEYENKNGKKIYMSHAGFTPYNYNEWPDDEALIWDRKHYFRAWSKECPNDIIIIHGHTPIEYLDEDLRFFFNKDKESVELPVAYWYCGGHKCCIDNGAFYTKCTVMLDLDTFEVHKFFADDYNPEEKWD